MTSERSFSIENTLDFITRFNQQTIGLSVSQENGRLFLTGLYLVMHARNVLLIDFERFTVVEHKRLNKREIIHFFEAIH